MKKPQRRLTAERAEAMMANEALDIRVRIQAFFTQIIVPMEQRIAWLETPWYKRLWIRHKTWYGEATI